MSDRYIVGFCPFCDRLFPFRDGQGMPENRRNRDHLNVLVGRHVRAEHGDVSPEARLAAYQRHGNRVVRLWRPDGAEAK